MIDMKGLVVMCCVISVVLCSDEKYPDKYDNINAQEIVENPKLRENYFKCLMDTGKCTAEGKELRTHMEDAIKTGCSKCTEVQEQKTYSIMEYLINNHRDMWDALCEKYDSTGKWRKTYEDRAKAKGLKIPGN